MKISDRFLLWGNDGQEYSRNKKIVEGAMAGNSESNQAWVIASMAGIGRRLSKDTMVRFEAYMSEIFSALGMDLGEPSTAETPRRFIQALYEATEGYDGDPKLIKAFDTECKGGPDCRLSQIIEGPIRFYALCEHHAFPFYGHAFVGYIAYEHIIGISKLARLVQLFARRFAVQERIGQQIADAMLEILKPHGVAVYLEAEHLCMKMRGVRETASSTRTSFWRGEYDTNPELRLEFLNQCGLKQTYLGGVGCDDRSV
jgi:GTP cyclohydrolase IA